MARPDAWTGGGTAATAAAGLIFAQQVASKATRDTLFLSCFPVVRWPAMLAWASIVSIVVAAIAARAMTRLGPGRVMPATCALSAVLLLGIAMLATRQPSAAAVLLFLQVAAIGPVVISGFWSLFSERFDPRTARRAIARVGGFGTLGGLAGGLLGNEVAKRAGVVTMLPILAALSLLAVVPIHFLARETRTIEPAGEAPPPLDAGFRHLVTRPYLRDLGVLMLLTTASAALLDYVFRHQASMAYSGDRLMAVFSTFYSAVALLTFLLQISLTQLALDRVPVGRTVTTLPAAVVASCLGVLAIPGLLSSAIARGIEMVMSNSIFRLGYELLYTPVAPNEKRPTKALIDVAAGRAGDALGGGLTLLILMLATRRQNIVLLIGSALLALLAFAFSLRLSRGYVRALEGNLQGASPGGPAPLDMSETIDLSLFPIPIARLPREDLRSSEVDRVRRAVAAAEPIPIDLVPWAIPLLADRDIAPDVARALHKTGPQVIDPLVQSLLDPERPVDVRRRIARILGLFADARAVQGLLMGLEDVRFRVRVQCGRALARLREVAPDLPIERERLLAAVLREAEIEKHVWGGQREMERLEDAADSPVVDLVRERASASLQNIFTLLSAALPERALLRLAFNGLYSGDPRSRGTALEYLDIVLPSAIKEAVWPYLEERGRRPRPMRTREEIVAELTSINESIRISIEELRKLHPDE